MSENDKDVTTAVNFQSNLITSSNNDIESVSAKTEDSLLNTRSNSETTSISKTEQNKNCCRKKPGKCGTYCELTTGVILCILGILLLIWPPFHILMESRIDMIPGLPPFEWWKDPPQEVRLKAYIFNVTNSEEFLEGTDEKLKIEEIGPIIYLEKLEHKNVHFNENGTLTYTVNRSAVYLPEENTIDLNTTIIVPNYAILGMATHLSTAPFYVKMGFNMLLRTMNTKLFTEITIEDFFWNFTDPVLSFAQTIQPDMVPDLNIGMLHVIYRDFEDTATVYVGRKHGHDKFFLLNNFNGFEYVPGYGSECQNSIVNSTEGALYPQYITKNTTFLFWRKTLCKVMALHYDSEHFMDKYGVLAYKFVKGTENYDRKANLSADCNKGDPVLPKGFFDVSKCYYGASMAASYPHYLHTNEDYESYIEGLKPNASLHNSFAYIEPTTGIPIESIARSQSNIIIRDTSSFNSNLRKFSNRILPMFWIEYNQLGLPYYVTFLMKFIVLYVPKYQYYFIAFLLLLGSYCLVSCYRKLSKRNKNIYCENTSMQFEKETFLDK